MKWIFFAYGLFAIATILRYLPPGRFGLALRLGNASYGMSFNLIAFWLLLAVGSIMILVQVAGTIINVTANAPVYRPYQAVEEKARLLQDNNQDTYCALADEIFKAPRGLGILSLDGIGLENIPAAITTVIKDRLVYAEMQYRQGTGRAVREQDIVDVTNLLVQKLELPDYVRTSPSQVRYVRMALITWNPTFMGRGAAQPDMQVGESISDEMSPMQAVHVLLEVLGHKFFDQNFQMTPEAWDLTRSPQSNQTSKQSSGHIQLTKYAVVALTNPKMDELRTLLAQRVGSMNPAKGLSLIRQMLETLGI